MSGMEGKADRDADADIGPAALTLGWRNPEIVFIRVPARRRPRDGVGAGPSSDGPHGDPEGDVTPDGVD